MDFTVSQSTRVQINSSSYDFIPQSHNLSQNVESHSRGYIIQTTRKASELKHRSCTNKRNPGTEYVKNLTELRHREFCTLGKLFHPWWKNEEEEGPRDNFGKPPVAHQKEGQSVGTRSSCLITTGPSPGWQHWTLKARSLGFRTGFLKRQDCLGKGAPQWPRKLESGSKWKADYQPLASSHHKPCYRRAS